MPESVPGLYEALITENLTADLARVGGGLYVVRDALRSPEAADRISLHLGHVIEQALQRVGDSQRASLSVTLAQQIIDLIQNFTGDDSVRNDRPVDPGEVLRAVHRFLPDGQRTDIQAPSTPLLDTTLLTNAPHEPRIGAQIEHPTIRGSICFVRCRCCLSE
jgi:hypothetical protein